LKYTIKEEIEKYFRKAKQLNLINAEDTALIFCDWSIIADRVARIKYSFPKSAQHCIPIKTNPMFAVLKYISNLPHPLSFEAASLNELLLAKETGVSNERLVLDSPSKTEAELFYINKYLPNITINCNDCSEVYHHYSAMSKARLGLRINPLIKPITQSEFNVSSNESKFGESILNEKDIIACFKDHPNLKGLHVHAASNFTQFDAIVEGIYKVEQLALKINLELKEKRIEFVDIGGGFAAGCDPLRPVEIEYYIKALRVKCRWLFSDEVQLLTEFGRYIHTNACWGLSLVESITKKNKNNIVINHLGADMFLRAAYSKKELEARVFVLDINGKLKNNHIEQSYDIEGPLCFAGDRILSEISLPEIERHDRLVLTDIGANTFALWSKHCSRSFPKVIAYSSSKQGKDLVIIKKRESFSDILRFWS
jgi:diaminopimelate decarboxylase